MHGRVGDYSLRKAAKPYLEEALSEGCELGLYGVLQHPLCVAPDKFLSVGVSHGNLAAAFYQRVLPQFPIVIVLHLEVAADKALNIALHVKELLQAPAKLWEIILEVLQELRIIILPLHIDRDSISLLQKD